MIYAALILGSLKQKPVLSSACHACRRIVVSTPLASVGHAEMIDHWSAGRIRHVMGCFSTDKGREKRQKVLQTSGRKISPKRKCSGRTSCGHPGVIRMDIPAQNFGQGGRNPGKKQAFRHGHPWPEGADVHAPKGFPKTSVRKTLGWIFVP